ncbi:MAG: protein translocase subunit SecF [Nitrospinae bacterium]|nr:protein translocase subunit SecF [Nitrospinota bacterium]
MRLFAIKPKVNWLKYKKMGYVFSGTLTALTVVLLIAHGGLKYGIDFAGGTLMQVKFKAAPSLPAVRTAVESAGFGGDIQQFGQPVDVLINIHPKKGESEEQATKKVASLLESQFGKDSFTVERTEIVGPKVGKDLATKAMLAVLYSTVGILIFLAFRFEFRFAITAIIALLHDIIVTLGAITITGKEFSLPLLAAIMTVIGYSLNDRIVVSDRIRENLRLKRSLDLPTLVNESVNETMSRTMITASLMLVVVLALFLFGGVVLHDFAFTLLVGIGFGTYSSVFVASALLVDWPGTTTQKLALSIRKS